MKALDLAIQLAGGTTKLARKLNLHHSNIAHWRERGVPPRAAIEIEKLWNGAIRAVDFYEGKE